MNARVLLITAASVLVVTGSCVGKELTPNQFFSGSNKEMRATVALGNGTVYNAVYVKAVSKNWADISFSAKKVSGEKFVGGERKTVWIQVPWVTEVKLEAIEPESQKVPAQAKSHDKKTIEHESAKRDPEPTIDGRSGEEILRGFIDRRLSKYELRFAELHWSGHRAEDKFSRHTGFIIKDTTTKEVADILDAEFDTLPSIRGWGSHGGGRRGNKILQLRYVEEDNQHYLDCVLVQVSKDVDVTIFYKGIKR